VTDRTELNANFTDMFPDVVAKGRKAEAPSGELSDPP
jgi:hypothetical protein